MSTPLPKPKGVLAWTEPESAANSDYQPVYPYNTITQTKGGHSFEMKITHQVLGFVTNQLLMIF